jgi:hypothetical protein
MEGMKGNFRKIPFLYGKPVLGNDKLCKVKNSFGLGDHQTKQDKKGIKALVLNFSYQLCV